MQVVLIYKALAGPAEIRGILEGGGGVNRYRDCLNYNHQELYLPFRPLKKYTCFSVPRPLPFWGPPPIFSLNFF